VMVLIRVLVGLLVLALAVWGVPGVSAVWPAVATVAGLLSVVVLTLFWSRQLVFGLALDLGLIAVAVTRPTFVDRFLS